jgi:hypothetical protein
MAAQFVGATRGSAKVGCRQSAVVLLNGRPEIWPATQGIEILAKSIGATLVRFCATREEALAALIPLAESGPPLGLVSPFLAIG